MVLVTGPTTLPDPVGMRVIRVNTAQEMFDAVIGAAKKATIAIMAAAVSDWRPATIAQHKIKKEEMAEHLLLERTADILKTLGENKTNQILVGFAAETRDLQHNASAKLNEKNLDLIVGNLIGEPDSAFGSDTNQVSLFHQDGSNETLPRMDKEAVADVLFDRILALKQK